MPEYTDTLYINWYKVGNRLKELRDEKRLTQDELLREFSELSVIMINKDSTTMSKWENGTRPLPRDTINVYCKYFGVTSNWILYGEGSRFDLYDAGSARLKNAVSCYREYLDTGNEQHLKRFQKYIDSSSNNADVKRLNGALCKGIAQAHLELKRCPDNNNIV